MERVNAPTYSTLLAEIDLRPADALLEIGFGTGAFLRLAADRLQQGFLAGVDPSPLMLKMTKKKLQQTKIAFEVRLGDDQNLDWTEHKFDHVVALHSFQFWHDPASTLDRISYLLKPNGDLWLCLRNHEDNPPDWLPNPISRSRHEVSETLDLLKRLGFQAVQRVANNQKLDLLHARGAG
ncbi:MAG: class I SAM-dependent methyltransferase [Pseudomonadota bacterium]